MIRVGVIGYGYWGPNIVRNFQGVQGVQVNMICDLNTANCHMAKAAFPGVHVTRDAAEVLWSTEL
ncbi:MAG: ydgJ 3 [Bryobacterales bacterium]|nr:ydgJ 3 [Bryobacterales bacterium]